MRQHEARRIKHAAHRLHSPDVLEPLSDAA